MRERESSASESARSGCIRQVARALPAAHSTVNIPASSTPRFVVTLDVDGKHRPPTRGGGSSFPGWLRSRAGGRFHLHHLDGAAPTDPAVLWTGRAMGKSYRPKDHYFQQAKRQGLRARSAFKLEE